MFISRYFNELVGKSLFLITFSFNETSGTFLGGLNKATSVLLIFKQTLFAFSQLVFSSLD